MTAPVRAAVAVEAAEVEAAAVLPSQGRLFAAALPLPVRPPRSAQRLPLRLPLRLYLLPWPPVWPALFRALQDRPGLCPRFRLPRHPVRPQYQQPRPSPRSRFPARLPIQFRERPPRRRFRNRSRPPLFRPLLFPPRAFPLERQAVARCSKQPAAPRNLQGPGQERRAPGSED